MIFFLAICLKIVFYLQNKENCNKYWEVVTYIDISIGLNFYSHITWNGAVYLEDYKKKIKLFQPMLYA